MSREQLRPCYLVNVKNRLGSRLPAGISETPHFTKPPWEAAVLPVMEAAINSQRQHQTSNHIPHIRNPQLRHYYLQGTSRSLSDAAVTKDHKGQQSDDISSSSSSSSVSQQELVYCLLNDFMFSEGVQGFTVDPALGLSSMFNVSAQHKRMGHNPSLCFSSGDPVPTELVGLKNTDSSQHGAPEPEPEPGPEPEPKSSASPVQPPSSPAEAEYDRLLDVEAVPLPDGQLCLLALPAECCEGAGPEAVPYLKLFCRYVTDRKGVVSGILLVTSHKLVFDPFKTHPLVEEHGCEEYFLSRSIDNLLSVTFYSDISHLHFTSSHHRRKGKKLSQKLKSSKSCTRSRPHHHEDWTPVIWTSLSLSQANTEGRDEAKGCLAKHSSLEEEAKAEVDLKTETLPAAGYQMSSAGSPSGWMFVRLRFHPSNKRRIFQLNSSNSRDEWLALTKESSDQLNSYLKRQRPDLIQLEGGAEEEEEEEEGGAEEEFVLIEDREEEKEEQQEGECLQRRAGSGGDWEDWEMVLMEEKGAEPLFVDREPEGLEQIVESSRILEALHVQQLCEDLPVRSSSLRWRLVYSTSRHGCSLKRLYRNLSETECPALVVIKDAHAEMFGAFLSHPLRPSETFYGTGETFLFMLHPRFKSFKWTGENSFFIKGDLDSFTIGGGSGHFGLWVDESLFLGRSSPCFTFNNCCLSQTEDFRVMEMEVWTLS